MKTLLAAVCVLISGCTANTAVSFSRSTPEHINTDSVKAIHFGIPHILGASGTEIRLPGNIAASASHNTIILPAGAINHAVCDIALYARRSGSSAVESKAKLVPGQTVYFVGHVSPLLPVQVHKGKYLGDGEVSNGGRCRYSFATAGNIEGMSGGAVFNEAGELVGIISGILKGTAEFSGVKYKRPSIFVSLHEVSDWMAEAKNKVGE